MNFFAYAAERLNASRENIVRVRPVDDTLEVQFSSGTVLYIPKPEETEPAAPPPPPPVPELSSLPVADLKAVAKAEGMKGYSKLGRDALIEAIEEHRHG